MTLAQSGRSHDFYCAVCRCFISGFDLHPDQTTCDECGSTLEYDPNHELATAP